MSSPFSSAKEFLEAKGPIYTFANNPTAIAILLALSAGISIYFIYASYTMKREEKSNDPAMMSVLLIAGLTASLAGSLLGYQKKQPVNASRQEMRYEQRAERYSQPMTALLGLMGGGAVWKHQKLVRKRRKQRRF